MFCERINSAMSSAVAVPTCWMWLKHTCSAKKGICNRSSQHKVYNTFIHITHHTSHMDTACIGTTARHSTARQTYGTRHSVSKNSSSNSEPAYHGPPVMSRPGSNS